MKKGFRIIGVLVDIIFVFVFAACSNQFDELKKSIKVISEEDKNSENDSSEENPEEVTYYVEHCIQNIYDDDYTLESVQIKTGLPGQMTQAEPKTYAGCVTKSVTQKNINAGGSTIARIYYDRKDITYTFKIDPKYGKFADNTNSKSITKRYGAEVEIPKISMTTNIFTPSQWLSTIPKTYGDVNQTFTVTFEINYYDKITYLPAGTDGSAGTEATYVYFGVFPQTKSGRDVTVTANSSTSLYVESIPFYLGSDYEYYTKHKSYNYWYRLEPIKWRVVTTNFNNTGKALLVAEKILIASGTGGTVWETSRIRIYLNNSFYKTAFKSSAKALIAETDTTLTSSTSNTKDKVFLLSSPEIKNPEYGFTTVENRNRTPTDYAEDTNVDNSIYYGCKISTGFVYNWWWFRDNITPWDGMANGNYSQINNSYQYIGVVPAITVTLPPQ